MSSAERVWFLLVDSKGAEYMGATADFVRLPEDAIVADLRKAVKLENPNKLADVDSSNLAVFRNAAHFSARQTEGPLEEDAELGVMGKSKKDALIVLVPSPVGRRCFFV